MERTWHKKAKMTGLFLLFVLPLTLLLVIEIHEINKWIEFTRKERIGAEYNRSLRTLLQNLMHHRGATVAYLSGDPSFTDTIAADHIRIEGNIRAVDSLNQRYGRLLKTDDRWNRLKKRWQELDYTEFSSTPKESFDNHTAIITDVLDMISHIGETSNLILDPEVTTTLTN